MSELVVEGGWQRGGPSLLIWRRTQYFSEGYYLNLLPIGAHLEEDDLGWVLAEEVEDRDEEHDVRLAGHDCVLVVQLLMGSFMFILMVMRPRMNGTDAL